MEFLDRFLSYFNDQEKSSELVQIIASVGSNLERSYSEELRRLVIQTTDFSSMPPIQVRSLLAYFLVLVREFTAASGSASITIDSATAVTEIFAGEALISKSGPLFTLQDNLFLSPGDSATFQVVQEEVNSVSGTYNGYITIPVEGPDLDRMTVTLGGIEVPRVDAIANGSVVPSGGYFPLYFAGTLYVVIYEGGEFPDPNGLTYTVEYAVCEGLLGNIGLNDLSSFQSSIVDNNGNPVTYTLTNDPITTGANSPSLGELINLLRIWMFVKGSVSSIPEYTTWFLAHPYVADCKVESDYSRWVDTGGTGPLDVTGRVYANLISSSLEPLDTAQMEVLEAQLSEVRDLAIVTYLTSIQIKEYFLVRYRSVEDTAFFTAAVRSLFEKYFSLSFAQSSGLSLFDPLDVNELFKELPFQYNPVGVEIIPYHFTTEPVDTTGTPVVITLTSFQGENPGSGYYIFTPDSGSGQIVFTEHLQQDGTVIILDPFGSEIGSHDYENHFVTFSYTFSEVGDVDAYWEIINRSFPPVGYVEDATKISGVRVLEGVGFEQYT